MTEASDYHALWYTMLLFGLMFKADFIINQLKQQACTCTGLCCYDNSYYGNCKLSFCAHPLLSLSRPSFPSSSLRAPGALGYKFTSIS